MVWQLHNLINYNLKQTNKGDKKKGWCLNKNYAEFFGHLLKVT